MTSKPAAYAVALACLLGLATVSACGGASDRSTDVRIVGFSIWQGRAVWQLSCEPAAGDVADPARACAAIASQPRLVTAPEPFGCGGSIHSWWDITISGRIDGRPFRSSLSTCYWTRQVPLIGKLGLDDLASALIPRRTRRIVVGEERTFPRGELRPGDGVICTSGEVELSTGVDQPRGRREARTADRHHHVSLEVVRHHDGSVTATCTWV